MRLDSFLFNNVRVKYVGTDPDTGISLYVNDGHGGVIGVKVYPNGRQKQVNPRMIKKRGGAQSRNNDVSLQKPHQTTIKINHL